MRIVLIILSIAALSFIGFIVWMFAGKNITPQTGNAPHTDAVDASLAVETLKYQIKTEQKLNELSARLDEITGTKTDTTTPALDTSTSTWEPEKENAPIPVSAKFLSKILPTIELKQIDSTGIFDLKTFDKTTVYSTYEDAKFGMTVIASMLPYDTFLKNFKSLDPSVYTTNETTGFPFKSFYVNPPKSDSTVRIVFEVETETLLISLPKSKFDTFKKMILTK